MRFIVQISIVIQLICPYIINNSLTYDCLPLLNTVTPFFIMQRIRFVCEIYIQSNIPLFSEQNICLRFKLKCLSSVKLLRDLENMSLDN